MGMSRQQDARNLPALDASGSVGRDELGQASTVTELAKLLLTKLTGEDFDTEHLEKTPQRFANMIRDLVTPEPFRFTAFTNTEGIDEMVCVQGIQFYSLCAHHILPFYGTAHVAYIPDGLVAGLSKLARTVKYYSKGLNVQEELTNTIANHLSGALRPKGVAVVMEGEHLCMTMRGVQSPGTLTTTSAMRGVFLDPQRGARQEFLSLIRKGS